MARLASYQPGVRALVGIVATILLGTGLGGCDAPTVGPAELGSLQTLPDLVMDSVYYTTMGSLDDLDTAMIHVRVRNAGSTDAAPTVLEMFVDSQFAAFVDLDGIPALEDTVVAFAWEASAGEHQFHFEVDAPPANAVQETNESNNTKTHQLSVPYRERLITATDTITFGAIPLSIRTDSLVQDVLGMLADSGHVVDSVAPAIWTQYEPGPVATYIVPLGSWSGLADSVPILVIMVQPASGGTLVIPYVLQTRGDSYLMYDAAAGIEVSDGGATVTDFEQPAGAGPVLEIAASSSCSENSFWKCVRAGLMGVACVSNAIGSVGTPTPEAIVNALRTCRLALSSAGKCINAFIDNRPVVTSRSPTALRCQACQGRDLVTWECRGRTLQVKDDRGPAYFTTESSWTPSNCANPGEFRFEAVDCGGNITRGTLTAGRRNISRQRNHPSCIHSQGGGL